MRMTFLWIFSSVFLHGYAFGDWISLNGEHNPSPPHISVLFQSEQEIVLEVSFPGLLSKEIRIDGKSMVEWRILGGSYVMETGAPSLPYFAKLLAIRGDFAFVEVLSVKEKDIKEVKIAPFPDKPKRCESRRFEYRCNTKRYSEDKYIPEKWADLDSIGVFAGVHVARLVFYPVRYNPKVSQAKVAYNMVVRVFLGNGNKPKSMFRSYDKIMNHLLMNYKVIKQEAEHKPEHILIITHDLFIEGLEEFVAWKRLMGYRVDVAKVSEIGDTAEEIKEYIKGLYGTKSRPSHVILVGDAEYVPYFQGDDGCASDWMYTTIEGDDLYSDIIISRISAKTVDDVKKYCDKVIFYEKTPQDNNMWLEKAIFISSSEGEGESNDDYRSDIMAKMAEDYGYIVIDKFYHSKGNDTVENILDSLNQGRGMLTYLGHGSGTSWATTIPEFSVEHIMGLENAWMNPFIMDVSCSNGAFDADYDCFAETWMKSWKDGPIGGLVIYSSSTPTAWDEPAEMAVGFTKGILEKGILMWGNACLYARAFLIEKMGSNDNVKLVFQQYVQFGDASLILRTKKPCKISLSYQDVIPVGSVLFSAKVENPSGLGQESLVAIRKDEEFSDSRYTDINGEASFNVETETVGDMDIVVTSKNCEPYFGTIKVEATGCGVVHISPDAQNCKGEFEISLWDKDLDLDPMIMDFAEVYILKDGAQKMALLLKETDVSSGLFKAKIGVDELSGKDGEKITVLYKDMDCNGMNKEAQDWAKIDCASPKILSFEVKDITSTSAKLVLVSDEESQADFFIGTKIPPDQKVAKTSGTVHKVYLKDLEKETVYYMMVELKDLVGNVGVDDNGGKYWSFTTPECTPNCEGKKCGDDGCGGECGKCKVDEVCMYNLCLVPGCSEKPGPGWENAKCEKCVCDVDSYCCNFSWDSLCVEECKSLCGGCGSICVPSCDEKDCGDDGCGGTCGDCPNGWQCEASKCVCKTQCDNKECGDDGCGGSCGICLIGYECIDGLCICKPKCEQKECGHDGCGGTCGKCINPCNGEEDDNLCKDGKCINICCPECKGKECGDDGCGGQCGECNQGEICNEIGLCQKIVIEETEALDATIDDPAEPLDSKRRNGGCIGGHHIMAWWIILPMCMIRFRRLKRKL